MIASLACLVFACAPVDVSGWWALRASCGSGSLSLQQTGAEVSGTIELCGQIGTVGGLVRSNEARLTVGTEELVLLVAGLRASSPDGLEAWRSDYPPGEPVDRPGEVDDDEAMAYHPCAKTAAFASSTSPPGSHPGSACAPSASPRESSSR